MGITESVSVHPLTGLMVYSLPVALKPWRVSATGRTGIEECLSSSHINTNHNALNIIWFYLLLDLKVLEGVTVFFIPTPASCLTHNISSLQICDNEQTDWF